MQESVIRMRDSAIETVKINIMICTKIQVKFIIISLVRCRYNGNLKVTSKEIQKKVLQRRWFRGLQSMCRMCPCSVKVEMTNVCSFPECRFVLQSLVCPRQRRRPQNCQNERVIRQESEL